MVNLLLSPSSVKENINKEDVVNIIQDSNYIYYNTSMSKDINQFIEKKTFDNISNIATTDRELLNDINSNLINDFVSRRHIELVEQPRIGSLVNTNNKPSVEGVITNILRGNRDIAFLCPVSDNKIDATDKSLILNENAKTQNTPFVLLCEFSFPLFLDTLIIKEASFLNRELINKVNEFSKKGKADYRTFDTGVPNFDALDIRIASRTLLDEKIETISLETINFLEEEFVEDGEKEIFYNIVNDFDIAFAPYKVNKEELKKEHGELDSNKIATDLSQVKKILDKVA